MKRLFLLVFIVSICLASVCAINLSSYKFIEESDLSGTVAYHGEEGPGTEIYGMFELVIHIAKARLPIRIENSDKEAIQSVLRLTKRDPKNVDYYGFYIPIEFMVNCPYYKGKASLRLYMNNDLAKTISKYIKPEEKYRLISTISLFDQFSWSGNGLVNDYMTESEYSDYIKQKK